MIECAVWWATPVADPGEYLPLLTDAERERHAAYRREDDRRRFVTGRVLAKTLAARRLGADPADIVFDATCEDCGKQHGPPRIPGAGLALSISHAGERIGLALADDVAIGLDVESTSRRADDSMLDYALNATERAALDGLSGPERARAFFRYWTGKEALMKATGRGLRIPLQSLTLAGPGERPRLAASAEPALSPERTRMAELDPGEGYHAAVALLTADEVQITERWWGAAPSAPGQ